MEIELGKMLVDHTGQFRFSIQNYPEVTITAKKKGYAKISTVKRSFEAEKIDNTTILNHEFILPLPAAFKGNLVDLQGVPLKGITLQVMTHENTETGQSVIVSEVVTDEQGYFSINDLAKGDVSVIVNANGYVPLVQTISIPKEDIVLTLSSDGALAEGRIYHKDTGAIIPDARVWLHLDTRQNRPYFNLPPFEQKSDETGAFRFEHLLEGSYFLGAEKDFLYPITTSNKTDYYIILKKNEEKRDIKSYLYGGHTVKKTVINNKTAQPLEGVTIELHPPYSSLNKDIRTALTDSAGKYEIYGYCENMKIVTKKEKFEKSITSIPLSPDTMEITKDITMNPLLTLSGVVLKPDGKPAVKAKVSLTTARGFSGKNLDNPVDDSGAFEFVIDPFSKCWIKAEMPGYSPSFQNFVEVKKVSVENVAITLEPGVTIQGTVIGPDQKPVIRADVTANLGDMGYNPIIIKTITDNHGHFTFVDIPLKKITLSASCKGYAPNSVSLDVKAGENSSVNLILHPSIILEGIVIAPDGAFAQGVDLQVSPAQSGIVSHRNGKTDAQGRFRIEGLSKGFYSITLRHPEYGSRHYRKINVAEETPLVLYMDEEERSTFIGIVKDWQTGEPVNDFTVLVQGEQQIKVEREGPGRFILKNLKREGYFYLLTITSPGYIPIKEYRLKIPHEDLMKEDTFYMGQGAIVQGITIDNKTGLALAGVRIQLNGVGKEWGTDMPSPEAETVTDENGRFEFKAVPSGINYLYFLPPEPFAMRRRDVICEHGAVADMGNIGFGEGTILQGHVYQMPGAVPISGMYVFLIPQNLSTKTNEQGFYEFKELREGKCFLRIPRHNFDRELTLQEDDVVEQDIRIGSGLLKGKVLDNDGSPAVCTVNLRQSSLDRWINADTGPDGNFEIKDLAPGRWRITIYENVGWSLLFVMEEWIDIKSGDITEKIFTYPSGRITGIVLDPQGQPVSGIPVVAIHSKPIHPDDALQPLNWWDFTDFLGKFEIENLPPGIFSVSAHTHSQGLGFSLEEQVIIGKGETKTITLRLQTSGTGFLVSETLTMERGNPIPGAWCNISNASGIRLYHGQARNEKGVMKINHLPPGTYHVQVSAEGYSANLHTVDIETSETIEMVDVLYKTGDLRWALMDKTGAPLPNISCRIEPVAQNSIENPREGKTDKNGLWMERSLFPEEYRVLFIQPDGKNITQNVLIREGALTEKEWVVK